ncbi:hypothetical protein ACFJIW_11750 [Tahibacter sp. UC22_41]|uniref:hypothetical protein n=1 Tax=Tahibacter sp. UC22_41 TaxID=3350178 RepID=UPI0036D7EA25
MSRSSSSRCAALESALGQQPVALLQRLARRVEHGRSQRQRRIGRGQGRRQQREAEQRAAQGGQHRPDCGDGGGTIMGWRYRTE